MAKRFHGHGSARGNGESGQRPILFQGEREPDLSLYSVHRGSGSSLGIGRRGFVKALLGAGAGLWVPEKTYFFFGPAQESVFSDILDELSLYMNSHPSPIYPDLSRPWFRSEPRPIRFFDA